MELEARWKKIKQVSNTVGKKKTKQRGRGLTCDMVCIHLARAAQEHSGLFTGIRTQGLTHLSTACSLFRTSFWKRHDNAVLHNKANRTENTQAV